MSALYLLLVTSDTTIDFTYNTYVVDATSGSLTITIDPSPGDGENFTISRIDSSTNSVYVTAGSASINENPYTTTLDRLDNVQLASLSGNWYTIVGTVI